MTREQITKLAFRLVGSGSEIPEGLIFLLDFIDQLDQVSDQQNLKLAEQLLVEYSTQIVARLEKIEQEWLYVFIFTQEGLIFDSVLLSILMIEELDKTSSEIIKHWMVAICMIASLIEGFSYGNLLLSSDLLE